MYTYFEKSLEFITNTPEKLLKENDEIKNGRTLSCLQYFFNGSLKLRQFFRSHFRKNYNKFYHFDVNILFIGNVGCHCAGYYGVNMT